MAILNRRVITGWRSESIDSFLDYVVQIDGNVEVDRTREKMPDTLGRLHRIYADKAEKHRVERQRYKQQIKERDAARYQKLKDDHSSYVIAYRKTFPNSLPCSVNTFLKSGAHRMWVDGRLSEAIVHTFGLGDAMRARQDEGFRKLVELYGGKAPKRSK